MAERKRMNEEPWRDLDEWTRRGCPSPKPSAKELIEVPQRIKEVDEVIEYIMRQDREEKAFQKKLSELRSHVRHAIVVVELHDGTYLTVNPVPEPLLTQLLEDHLRASTQKKEGNR